MRTAIARNLSQDSLIVPPRLSLERSEGMAPSDSHEDDPRSKLVVEHSHQEHPYNNEPPGRAVILRQIVSRANPCVSAEIREVSERREMA